MYRARSETVLDSSVYTQNCLGQERSEHHMREFKELLNAIIGCTLQTVLRLDSSGTGTGQNKPGQIRDLDTRPV